MVTAEGEFGNDAGGLDAGRGDSGAGDAGQQVSPDGGAADAGTDGGGSSTGLVAEWPLDSSDVSGSTVTDVTDAGNDGTVVNGPLSFVASPLSQGATFDGTSQYVDIPLVVDFPSLTVSVWFDASGFGGSNPRLLANSHTDADDMGFQLEFDGTGNSGFFDVGNGATQASAAWSQQLTPGTWYDYVGVYDGNTVSAYLDGTLVAAVPFPGGAIAPSGQHVNIARNPVYGGDFFAGALSDVRIYNRALSDSEVQQLYAAGNADAG
jgi:hypothetical protein